MYSCRYQRSAHHLAKRTLFFQTCQRAKIWFDMFCCLLEIQKIDSWRKKLCTNIKKLSYRKKQQVYGPIAFGGCLPRAAQSSYLTSDHHPVGTEPSSGRGISRGRALYRRHIVLDCLCAVPVGERGGVLSSAYILPVSASAEWERDASYHPCRQGDWNLTGWVVIGRISWNMFYEPEGWRKSSQMATKVSKTEK